jgi:multidrug efflux pump subunit AcrB
MWIVRLALRRPYTFVVMSVLIAILGGIAAASMPTDIFPNIDIPVVSIVWNYAGISPDEMEKRMVTVSERSLTTTVNDIEHIESQSYNGVAVIRAFFHPYAKVELAIAQISAVSQAVLRRFPPGTYPPGIIKYSASSVPILQLSLSSKSLSEQQIFDLGTNFIRTNLATVQGASIPLPYGGKFRQIMVDLDPQAMYGKGLSATDVSNAINLQNLILPAGDAKFGDRDYLVRVNSSPLNVMDLNDMPIKTVNGATVYIRDVAQVRDGYAVQTNIVRENGSRAALLTILKSGGASTLDIIDSVRKELARIKLGLPSSLVIKELFDQGLFVRAAINGVLREGIIAAALTGCMILLFLGSWRSTIIVCISIPLSILTSEIVLWLLGQTTNVMTLGGMALAVGILVDDATVEIENIHRNLGMRKPITKAILDGAQQIAIPAFVSTLAICIVFVPVLLLTGAAKYLFTPLAEAVVFAMLASYLLSRTLVPTMVHYLLRSEAKLYATSASLSAFEPEIGASVASHATKVASEKMGGAMSAASVTGEHGGGHEVGHATGGKGIFWFVHGKFNAIFEKARNRYRRLLAYALHHRGPVAIAFGIFALGSLGLAFVVGRDFFPYVDSGQMRMHVRAPVGTRIEETERLFGQMEDEIRQIIPPSDLDTLLDNIGLPNGGFNLAFSDSSVIGPADGDILISLREGRRLPTKVYERRLRSTLNEKFPQTIIYFQAANITNQILNFGLPAPIDLQIVGRDTRNFDIAVQLAHDIAKVPGAVDVHVHQQVGYPEVEVDVDRTRAAQIGLTQRDVSNSLLISLAGTGQVAPNFWLNFDNGVSYDIGVQTPQYRIQNLQDLQATPISAPQSAVASQADSAASMYGAPGNTQLLQNLATFRRTASRSIVNHYNVQPVFDVYANTDQRDLGGVAGDVEKIMKKYEGKLPRASFFILRGQVLTMESSFMRLGFGLLFAILLVYLLMVVNFQSWVDPFIILMAIPGALAGILWMLFVTQTTLNVPSLMGAIMCIGVATANSILMVTFANDLRFEGKDEMDAALLAGYTRIRPVIMTAAAMIIGMFPMALGLGEGGEQNAPLGRAVIGGLLVATFTTLIFVPVMYTFLRKKAPVHIEREIDHEAHEGETV